MTHTFHPSILREYDIRGIIDETLFEEDAFYIGRAFSTLISNPESAHVVVGWDGRHSSLSLKNSLVDGLLRSGLDVTEIGLGPTPLLYFALHHLNADGGIMITGSHNPKNHNGFKMVLKTGPVMGDQIKSFSKVVKDLPKEVAQGKLETIDLQNAFVDRLIQDLSLKAPINAVWDTGNGAAGQIVEKLVKRLPGSHTLLYGEINGDFPHHHPDPSVEENLEDLKTKVLASKADVGFAFDGDGDRIGIVNNKGISLPIDQMIMVLGRDVLEEYPKGTIIVDIKISQAVLDDIKAHGGTPLLWKTGHSVIKRKMKEVGALFAGEVSGHIFFNDKYYGYDDGLYTAVRFLNVLAKKGKPLDEVQKILPSFATSKEYRVDCADEEKFQKINQIKEAVAAAYPSLSLVTIDGLRVNHADGWWLVRASNTQSAIVFRAEGKTDHSLKDMMAEGQSFLSNVGLKLL